MNSQGVKEISKDLSIAKMSNDELHGHLKNKSCEERKLTHHILQVIAEVDQRKLYLRMAHPSLFDYLTKGIGYSAGSAQRRIDSARLLRQVPDLGNKIEEGKLNLGQVSQVQKALRLARKQDNTQLLPSEKKVLLEKLVNKSGPETELILAQEFDFPVEAEVKQKIQKDCSVRLELTLSQGQMQVLERAKALLSHAVPGGNLVDVIVHLSERYVKQRTGSSVNSKPKSSETATTNTEANATATVAAKGGGEDKGKEKVVSSHRDQKPLETSMKKMILNRDQGCQFTDRRTGKICGSSYFAEIDHVHPRFAGGTHEKENLRQMCRAHNQFRYKEGC